MSGSSRGVSVMWVGETSTYISFNVFAVCLRGGLCPLPRISSVL